MDVNKPILTLKRKPKHPVSEPAQDTAVVVNRNRVQAKPEPKPTEPKKPRPPRSIPVSEAYALLTPFWPALFDIGNVRLMKINVLQDLIQDKGRRGISLSNKMLKRSVKAISRSPAYLERVAVGQNRFDIEGNVSGEVTEHEYQYIRARRFTPKKHPTDLIPGDS
ncbi:ProQ/FINO family protein [Rahnella variigena]|uniref:ProQ/FINO family protein n=1 Tax=Rahnella variigena TaxID=574964 RepID=UPI00132F50DD|nr:ProQ/FINO family protein [Rahnella variigena]